MREKSRKISILLHSHCHGDEDASDFVVVDDDMMYKISPNDNL